jgi:Tat protein secretion system quality control protein TatD with DNase activity
MLYDAHCHISTDFDPSGLDDLIAKVQGLGQCQFVVMSTNHLDFQYVDALAQQCGNVIPSFGVHPWCSHLFTFDTALSKREHYELVFGKPVDDELLSLLPVPLDFDAHLEKLVGLCQNYTRVCWGEVGLDKLFRIPNSGYFCNPEFKGEPRLTQYRVSMAHQKQVLAKQLSVALVNDWPVSVHIVRAGGVLHGMLKELLEPHGISARLCLHSYTGSVDTLKLFYKDFKEHEIYVSLSTVLNGERPGLLQQLLAAVPASNLLIETDVCLDRWDPVPLLKTIGAAVGECGEAWERFISPR